MPPVVAYVRVSLPCPAPVLVSRTRMVDVVAPSAGSDEVTEISSRTYRVTSTVPVTVLSLPLWSPRRWTATPNVYVVSRPGSPTVANVTMKSLVAPLAAMSLATPGEVYRYADAVGWLEVQVLELVPLLLLAHVASVTQNVVFGFVTVIRSTVPAASVFCTVNLIWTAADPAVTEVGATVRP
ncbi:MAG: hypothetical protein HYU51_16320 [Candidatus Rokubacteria bacterium]|nr:hypothetical protein [Candidatus Rokubacteria bacterium]